MWTRIGAYEKTRSEPVVESSLQNEGNFDRFDIGGHECGKTLMCRGIDRYKTVYLPQPRFETNIGSNETLERIHTVYFYKSPKDVRDRFGTKS